MVPKERINRMHRFATINIKHAKIRKKKKPALGMDSQRFARGVVVVKRLGQQPLASTLTSSRLSIAKPRHGMEADFTEPKCFYWMRQCFCPAQQCSGTTSRWPVMLSNQDKT
jgi:hypothetical protein